MSELTPKNKAAQLFHRAAGNPPSTMPHSAISNCFPGLEFDVRNIWRRIFIGLVMHEADCYVLEVDSGVAALQAIQPGCRLLKILADDQVFDTTVVAFGPKTVGGPTEILGVPANPDAAWFMEWSNSLSRVPVPTQAPRHVRGVFTQQPSAYPRLASYDGPTVTVDLEVRAFFEHDVVIARELAQPGELTQSLCSPWLNDYRECACYYWASSRPDYVDVEAGSDGVSRGWNWMDKTRKPDAPVDERVYLPDPRRNQPGQNTWITYDELFQEWQKLLHFVIGGKDRE
jgi:hypothetical protein